MIVVLLFKPGTLRDGLSALLYTVPEVKLVVHAHDARAALEFCRKNPNILIIMEIRPGDRALLAQVPEMNALSPQTQEIALIHDEADRASAEDVGIDLIVDIGIRPPVLKAKIEDMIRNFPTVETNDPKRWLGGG